MRLPGVFSGSQCTYTFDGVLFVYIYIILSSIPCNCLHDQRSLSYCVYVPIDVYIADGAFNCGFTIYLTRALQCICVGSVKDIVLRFLQRARMYSVFFFPLCIYVESGCRHICNKNRHSC